MNNRRILCVLLGLLLLAMLPAMPARAAEILDRGVCGDNLTWTYASDGTLTISGTGDMWEYDRPHGPPPILPTWSDYEYDITRVVILPGVTSIGEDAFSYYSNLEEVIIPDSVTRISREAFHSCDVLAAVHIPGSVAQIGYRAFSYCEALSLVTLGNGIRCIGEYAFERCAMTRITVPGSVEQIGKSAFSGCESLEEVILLEGIPEIPGYSFSGCTSLTAVTIPASVASIGDSAFRNCTALTSFTVPAGVTSIGEGILGACKSLTAIHVEEGNPVFKSVDGVLYSMDGAVLLQYPCGRPGSYRVPYGTQTISANACPYSPVITGVTIPGTVTQICDSAFYGCDVLREVLLGEGIEEIGGYAFTGCPVSTVTFPSGVTLIGPGAFSGCESLTSLVFLGDAPQIYSGTFNDVTAAAFCSPENSTWNCDTMLDYGGSLTWTHLQEYPTLEQSDTQSVMGQADPVTVYPDCGIGAVTAVLVDGEPLAPEDYTLSSAAGSLTLSQAFLDTLQEGSHRIWILFPDGIARCRMTIAADHDHLYSGGRCTLCGARDETYLLRIGGQNRIATSLDIADALKQEMDVDRFDSIVVTSALNFPDALTGSYLASRKNAPILLTYDAVHGQIADYISENLAEGGIVYILGGKSAVSYDFETQLGQRGIRYWRVAGNDRFETNLAILNAAGVDYGQPLLVCTAFGFADSLSVSATGCPILLVGQSLTQMQKDFLARAWPGRIYIIGGYTAVSEAVEESLLPYGRDVLRLAGSNRHETSVMVAEAFFPEARAAVAAYSLNFPDGLSGGPLAFRLKAPLLLTLSGDGTATGYTAGQDIRGGYVLGTGELIDDPSARDLFGKSADSEIPLK